MKKRIIVRVSPHAKRQAIMADESGELFVVRVKCAPIDGKANTEMVSLVADYFDVPKSAVSIAHGQTNRTKVVDVQQ